MGKHGASIWQTPAIEDLDEAEVKSGVGGASDGGTLGDNTTS